MGGKAGRSWKAPACSVGGWGDSSRWLCFDCKRGLTGPSGGPGSGACAVSPQGSGPRRRHTMVREALLQRGALVNQGDLRNHAHWWAENSWAGIFFSFKILQVWRTWKIQNFIRLLKPLLKWQNFGSGERGGGCWGTGRGGRGCRGDAASASRVTDNAVWASWQRLRAPVPGMQLRTGTCTHMHTRTLMRAPTRMHVYTHACAHARRHTRSTMHAYAHTQMCTHTCTGGVRPSG